MTSHSTRAVRSVLVCPGSNRRMLEKAVSATADMVLIDLEDAVAPAEKPAARGETVRALRELDWGQKVRAYRINPLPTPWFYRDLIEVVEAAGDRVDLIVVPKVERLTDVAVVAGLLTSIEAAIGLDRPIGLEIQIESARGLTAIDAIATASERVDALVFGPGDFAASIGMPLTAIGAPDSWDAAYPGHRLHGVMQRILVAGRAADVRVIDGPYADFRDLDGLRQAATIARALGYDGKWCIHPGQIETVNEVFSPTEAEIAWARRVIEAIDDAARHGHGAAQLGGTMLDAASARMAERTLTQRKRTPAADR